MCTVIFKKKLYAKIKYEKIYNAMLSTYFGYTSLWVIFVFLFASLYSTLNVCHILGTCLQEKHWKDQHIKMPNGCLKR